MTTTQEPTTAATSDDLVNGRFLRALTMGIILLVGGLIGFGAAFVLIVEKFLLLSNPFYTPSCSVSARFNCGSVMTSSQAELLGFPNPLLGVAGFAVVATTGAGLLAGARFARWYWAGLQLVATAAVVFVHWLMVQSIFVIGALCPYCMVVWAVTIPIFAYVTLHQLTHRRNPGPRTGFLVRYHSTLVATWLAAIALLVAITTWFA